MTEVTDQTMRLSEAVAALLSTDDAEDLLAVVVVRTGDAPFTVITKDPTVVDHAVDRTERLTGHKSGTATQTLARDPQWVRDALDELAQRAARERE